MKLYQTFSWTKRNNQSRMEIMSALITNLTHWLYQILPLGRRDRWRSKWWILSKCLLSLPHNSATTHLPVNCRTEPIKSFNLTVMLQPPGPPRFCCQKAWLLNSGSCKRKAWNTLWFVRIYLSERLKCSSGRIPVNETYHDLFKLMGTSWDRLTRGELKAARFANMWYLSRPFFEI